jgi:hypothetical protein
MVQVRAAGVELDLSKQGAEEAAAASARANEQHRL